MRKIEKQSAQSDIHSMPAGAPTVATIVIVTYNCRRHIGDCLASLAGRGPAWEVIVVDNGSSDGTVESVRAAYPWACVVEAGSNIGFSAANNLGARKAASQWLFFLNPDTIVDRSALDALLLATRADGATVIAPRLNGLDGRYQPQSAELRLPTFFGLLRETALLHRIWPLGGGDRGGKIPNFDPNLSQLVEQPIGAALLVRRDVFESVGRFDDRFHPIWFEDVDLCKRLLEAGHTIRYEPSAVIVHVKQHSLGLFTATAVRSMFNANLIRYSRKHFSPREAAVMRVAAVIGTFVRGLIRAAMPGATVAAPGHLRLAWRMIRYSDEARWYG